MTMRKLFAGVAFGAALLATPAFALDMPVHGFYCLGLGKPYAVVIEPTALFMIAPNYDYPVPCYAVAIKGHEVTTECRDENDSVSHREVSQIVESGDHKSVRWSVDNPPQTVTLMACEEPGRLAAMRRKFFAGLALVLISVGYVFWSGMH